MFFLQAADRITLMCCLQISHKYFSLIMAENELFKKYTTQDNFMSRLSLEGERNWEFGVDI